MADILTRALGREFGGSPAPWMIPHIRRGLHHPAPFVRHMATDAMVICPTADCSEDLRTAAGRTSDPTVWGRAMRIWPEDVAPRRDLWPAALASNEETAYKGLANALAMYGTPEEAGICIDISRVNNDRVVEDSLHCLAHIQTPKTLDRLVFLADHGSDSVRRRALRVLPLLEDPRAAAAFERHLTEDNNSLSFRGGVKPSWWSPLLRRLALNPEHSHSRSALGDLLEEPVITPELASTCVEALDDSDPSVWDRARRRSETCLRGLERGHPELKDREARVAALRAIASSWKPLPE